MTFRRLSDLLYPVLTTYERAIAILPYAERLSLLVYCRVTRIAGYWSISPNVSLNIDQIGKCFRQNYTASWNLHHAVRKFLLWWEDSPKTSRVFNRSHVQIMGRTSTSFSVVSEGLRWSDPHTRKCLQQRSTRLTTSSRIRYRRYRTRTVTRLRAEWHWIRVSILSFEASGSALETKQSPTQKAPWALPPWVKLPGCAADHSPPFSAGHNNVWSYTSIAPVFIQLTGNTLTGSIYLVRPIPAATRLLRLRFRIPQGGMNTCLLWVLSVVR